MTYLDAAGIRFMGEQADREHQLVTYADRLWHHRVTDQTSPGYVCVGIGSGPHLDADGKYKHSSFAHRYFTWPHQLEPFVKLASRVAHHADIYVTPALRIRKDRRRGSAEAGRWLWVDVDGEWDIERQQRWERFAGTGAFMVHSGRGRHLYVPADDVLEPEELEERNRKLAGLFTTSAGVGEKWEANALLRPPGTFNWKPWVLGGDPAPVTLAEPT